MRCRSVAPGKVGAWCNGRWGPRHVRVDEVAAIAKAEDVYDCLLRDSRVQRCVGADGELSWLLGDRPLKLRWSLRSNRIWRGGRVFLLCPACRRLSTRLYLVTPDAPSPACRTCLRLTYESQLRNYRDDGLLRGFISFRDLSVRETELKRLTARRAACQRAARRRSLRAGLATHIQSRGNVPATRRST
jgi:hypothetical protein